MALYLLWAVSCYKVIAKNRSIYGSLSSEAIIIVVKGTAAWSPHTIAC